MSDLPLIACFHGGGSNSEIFEIQCFRLQERLQNDFRFVYFDAPFTCPAGPGVLPAFEDYGPFRTWFKRSEDGTDISDGSGNDSGGHDGIERLRNLMREQASPDEWVGVMGFSQGTRVASGILLDQQCRRSSQSDAKDDFNFRFGVLCMGGSSPMQSRAGKGMDSSIDTTSDLIQMPTLHLHGLKDFNLEPGRAQLAKYFGAAAELYEIDYHHAMPWVQADLDTFAQKIKELYLKSVK